MRILGFLILLGSVVFSPSFSLAEDSSIENSYKNIISNFLGNVYKDLPSKNGDNEIALYFEGEIPKYFAVDYIAAWSAGAYFKTLSEEQKVKYKEVFLDYLAKYYGAIFNKYYKHYVYKISTADKKSDTEYYVNMEVAPTDKNKAINGSDEAANVQWRVRYSKKDDKYYIIDILINNISLLNSQRADFESQIKANKGDIDTFISILEQKTETLTFQ